MFLKGSTAIIAGSAVLASGAFECGCACVARYAANAPPSAITAITIAAIAYRARDASVGIARAASSPPAEYSAAVFSGAESRELAAEFAASAGFAACCAQFGAETSAAGSIFSTGAMKR